MQNAPDEIVRLMICDDLEIDREGLRTPLDSYPQIQVVGVAESASEAAKLASTLKPDVLLLDLRMPALDGVDAIPAIQQASPDTRILTLTLFDTELDAERTLRRGAKGLISKRSPIEHIASAVLDVARGAEQVISKDARNAIDHRSCLHTRPSERIVEVLKLVNQGMSNRQIADALFIAESTVKAHLVRANEIFETNSRTDAIAEARRLGYL